MVTFKRYKKVHEADDIQNNGNGNTNNGTSSNASSEISSQKQSKLVQINSNIAELMNKKMQLRTTYQNEIKNIDTQIIQLQKQKAELGEDVDTNFMDESVSIKRNRLRFNKKLYEAVTNKRDEMFTEINLAFDRADGISIKPNNTRCRTFAKNIVIYLNKMKDSWNGQDHSEEFKDFVMSMLNNSQLSLSKREKDMFIDEFMNGIRDNALFNWIFGDK